MSRVEEYRQAMLARKAAKAGCSVEELLRRGEAELVRNRRAGEIRQCPMGAWLTLVDHALRNGRSWHVSRVSIPTP